MARPVWNGTISFGLLNVPVQLHAGERSAELRFHLLDSRNRSPIRYERINAQTGKAVDWKDIVKAFEYEKGNYVVLPDQEIRAAAPEATETVEIQAFVDREAISPVYFEKPYMLVPKKKAEKGYVLLRETLKKTGRIGIGKVVIRTRQYLAALMPEADALILNLMRFPEELVPSSEFDLPSNTLADYHITPRELDMASQLIDSMTTEWHAADYRDDFRDKLRGIIRQRIAKQTGGKVVETQTPAARQTATNVVDFMALLKKSLAAKGESGKRTARAHTRHRDEPAKPTERAAVAGRRVRQRPASRRPPTYRHRAG